MFGIEEDFKQLMEQVYGPLDGGEMTDKITLELTLDELKLIDKYVELNDETQSVFDKIKYAYPQLKMTLQQEGEYAIVSYNDTTYYRFMNETTFAWYMKIEYSTPTLVMVTDGETERLLDGLYYNHIEVKKEKEQRTKTSVEECYKDWWGQYPETGTWDGFDEKRWQGFQAGYEFAYAISTAKEVMEKVQEEQIKDAVRESVKWCEEHPDKDPLDYLKPQTPEEVADGLKEAFREAVKQGVVSSTKRETLTDVIWNWWEDVFTTNSNDDMETSIDDLVFRIEAWLPKEHDTNSYKWNQCIRTIKEKLR